MTNNELFQTFNNEFILPLKIQPYHFFKKKFLDETYFDENFQFQDFVYNFKLQNLELGENILIILDNQNIDIQGDSSFINIEQSSINNQNHFKINVDTKLFFDTKKDATIFILEYDFNGILEFNINEGVRQDNNKTSINVLHYQSFNQNTKSLYVFNTDKINNHTLNFVNKGSKENEDVSFFFNYYNLNSFLGKNYQDKNYIFNLSISSNIFFFQKEFSKSILKNNVIVNTVKNIYLNNSEETKINVTYFNCLGKEQLRDDAFEINHISSDFHSEIKYLVLNKGIATSQVNTYIDENTPRSKSHQKLKHIVLDDKAVSFSKPNLMIENPDVESSHGNSIGGMNKEHLIYLQQRGITEEKAKHILAISAIENATDTLYFKKIIKDYFLK